MSKVSDYKIEKFTSLKDTPNTYDPGKYVKVLDNSLDYDTVDTSTSGVSGGGLNYNYYFDTATDGNVASGTLQLNSSNYPGVSSIDISYYDKDGNDLSNWINSWDDSDKAVKGTLTLQSATHANKYAMFKLTETVDTTFGSGKDGDVTISGTVNLNTTAVASGRTYPDMVAYSVSSVGASSCQTTETPNGIEADDAVLLINLQGAGSSQYDNVGNYEIFVVDSIVNTTITFKSSKTKFYGDNGGDTNIGTGSGNHKVMVMRIPQYDNLTLQSGYNLTGNNWDGTKYGVVAFMCRTKATIIGTITAPVGYRGAGDQHGEGFAGRVGGLGGGNRYWTNGKGGGGGGHATAGATGSNGGSGGGSAYGVSSLTKIYPGSAGGAEGSHAGGNGAGIIICQCKELDIYGSLVATGYTGDNYGGGGAGGSILIKANKLSANSSTIEAKGMAGGASALGGAGRIAIYYNALMDSLSNVDPTPYTDSLTSGADKTEYNMSWLNNSGTFNDNEEVIVSYAYNY